MGKKLRLVMWLLQCKRCLNLTLSYHMLKWQQTSVIQILRSQKMQWPFGQASSWRLQVMHLLIMQMLRSCYACLGVFGGINVHHIHLDCVNGFCMTTCNKKLPCFGQVHMVLHDCFSLKMFWLSSYVIWSHPLNLNFN